jgi:hypothetical protein
MKKVIERIANDRLNQQVWEFELAVDLHLFRPLLYQSKTPTQRKFRVDGYWDRIMSRNSSIKEPPLPADVLLEARQYFKEQIDTLKVEK